jgi:hypothetical protein
VGKKMSESDDADMQRVADQIEAYLGEHPNAADTAEGIAEWWLMGLGVAVSRLQIQQALDYLGLKSVVRCTPNFSGDKVYSSNNVKADDSK